MYLPGAAGSALLLIAACSAPRSGTSQSVAPSQPSAPQKPTVAEVEPGPFKLTVNTTAVASKFLAYVGGGTNISPPDTIGGGDGIPAISFSNNGPAFLAGEISSEDKKTNSSKSRSLSQIQRTKPLLLRSATCG